MVNPPLPPHMETRNRRAVRVSVVAPAFNEAENLSRLYQELTAALQDVGELEIIIVENGSADDSLNVLRNLRNNDSRLNFISLSRNFGHQGGLLAGLEHATGDVIITMDADLQHPPAMLPPMLEQWEKGFDVVNTRKQPAEYSGFLRRFFDAVFYSALGKLSGIPLSERQSDFRLVDRRALNALNCLPEKNKFIRGLSYWIGFKQTTIAYVPLLRNAGASKFSLRHLMKFAIDGVISFTIIPLRLFSFIGAILSIAALSYGVFVVVYKYFYADYSLPPGWVSLAVGVYFIGGVMLIGIGVLGEYLGRLFDEVRGRPPYIVRETTMQPRLHGADRRPGTDHG